MTTLDFNIFLSSVALQKIAYFMSLSLMLSKKVGGEHVCVKKGDYAEILVPCDSRISMEMEKESKY